MQIPAQKCCKEHGKWTEHAHTVANTVENTMENERFELKTVAHTVEMAVSSSKMLQIAWKMVRTGNPKKNPQTKKKIPKQFPTPYYWDTELTVCHLADLLGQHLAHLRKWLTALT